MSSLLLLRPLAQALNRRPFAQGIRTMKNLTAAIKEDHDEVGRERTNAAVRALTLVQMYEYWSAYKKAYAAKDVPTATKWVNQLRWEVRVPRTIHAAEPFTRLAGRSPRRRGGDCCLSSHGEEHGRQGKEARRPRP